MACAYRRPAAGDVGATTTGYPCPGRGKKGDKIAEWFLIPLDSSSSFGRDFLRSRVLHHEGPQGRLVLKEAQQQSKQNFRSRMRTPCTGWPFLLCAAVDLQGKFRGLTASKICPTSRNRASVTPFRCTSPMCQRKRVCGSQEETRDRYGSLCLRRQTAAFPPVNTGSPGRRRRPLSTLTLSVNLASSGEPLYRRKVSRQLTVKRIFIYPSAEGCSE